MKDKILEILIDNIDSEDSYVSGEQLASRFNISRAAVWKHINSIREEGYTIESVRSRGYRITSLPEGRLCVQGVTSLLDTDFMGRELIYFESIGSTNDYIRMHAHELSEGATVFSELQTRGRGRIGREWINSSGEMIQMSLLLRPDLMPKDTPFITIIAAAAVLSALEEIFEEKMKNISDVDAEKNFNTAFKGCSEEISDADSTESSEKTAKKDSDSNQPKLGVKWPNDIILNGRKLCGILTELAMEIDRVSEVIVGIGMNTHVRELDESISDKATSLVLEGIDIDRERITAAILNSFERLYLKYVNHNDRVECLDIVNKYSITNGRDIYLFSADEPTRVNCKYIDRDGSLRVEYENGEIANISSGEISVRLEGRL